MTCKLSILLFCINGPVKREQYYNNVEAVKSAFLSYGFVPKKADEVLKHGKKLRAKESKLKTLVFVGCP